MLDRWSLISLPAANHVVFLPRAFWTSAVFDCFAAAFTEKEREGLYNARLKYHEATITYEGQPKNLENWTITKTFFLQLLISTVSFEVVLQILGNLNKRLYNAKLKYHEATVT
jgi:hypothetical protein